MSQASKYNNNQLVNNIFFSLLQVLISSVSLFFLYRFIFNTLGVRQLGIWSLISTAITALNLLNYGFSGSLVKFVAKYSSLQDYGKVKILIETTVLTLFGFSTILTLAGYMGFVFFMQFFISDSTDLILAFKVLPICMLTFWISVISSSFQAALDGLNSTYVKNIINVLASGALIVLSFSLIPFYGLLGLAYSYMLSSIFTALISWIYLRKSVPGLSIIPYNWNKESFTETLKYNANFQVISIFSILNDPITKFVLARFGGMELLGLYELVSKIMMQVRSIIVNVSQALVPMFANKNEVDPASIKTFYSKSFVYISILSIAFFSLIFALGPLLSTWWLGKVDPVFLFFLFAMCLSWFINCLNLPSYFSNLGTGNMKWNTISHVLMGCLNGLLSLLFAYIFAPQYIILGWAISLSIGSVLVIVNYHKENKTKLSGLIPEGSFSLLVFSVIFTAAEYIFCHEYIMAKPLLCWASIVAYLFIETVLLLRHPYKPEIIGFIRKKMNHRTNPE